MTATLAALYALALAVACLGAIGTYRTLRALALDLAGARAYRRLRRRDAALLAAWRA